MAFGETKVYFDGSHYIAIPHTTRDAVKRPKPPEEIITVVEELQPRREESACPDNTGAPAPLIAEENITKEECPEDAESQSKEAKRTLKTEYKITRKELFNRLYAENLNLPKSRRKSAIIAAMRPYFRTEELTAEYVDKNLERKLHNLISRRTRCVRKANLQEFNYFVTFTYDDKLHTEQSFRKKLKKCLSLLCFRKGWKYIGVLERSPGKQRLHFHGIFNIPEGTMPGYFEYVNDYNVNTHKRQITCQNVYFNDRFGRCDFEVIDDRNRLGDALAYLLKYIEKTGEKIVYSKGLPQFFISDIMDDDIVCRIGREDKKLLLFDDFRCWDEGVLIGNVSKETIKQLRTGN